MDHLFGNSFISVSCVSLSLPVSPVLASHPFAFANVNPSLGADTKQCFVVSVCSQSEKTFHVSFVGPDVKILSGGRPTKLLNCRANKHFSLFNAEIQSSSKIYSEWTTPL